MTFTDPIYNRFHAMLIRELKINWHRQQTTIGETAGISSSFMSNIVKGNKKATYENRAALAKACGYEYLEFLELGRELIDGPAKQSMSGSIPGSAAGSGSGSESAAAIEPLDPAVSICRDVISKFQDKDLIMAINQNLIKIETMHQKKYYMLAGRIENIAEELKESVREQLQEDRDKAINKKGNGPGKLKMA